MAGVEVRAVSQRHLGVRSNSAHEVHVCAEWAAGTVFTHGMCADLDERTGERELRAAGNPVS